MSARRYVQRVANRRRAKRVSDLREMQEIEKWLAVIGTTALTDWNRNGR